MEIDAETNKDKAYLLEKLNEKIDYYWGASRFNKRAFKGTRYVGVTLGAIVTLGASVQGALPDGSPWAGTINVLTPMLAAVLTIANGLSQSFHWGPAWREMVIAATRLEGHRDRIRVTPDADINAKDELEQMNRIISQETTGFFSRIFVGVPGSGSDEEQQASGVSSRFVK